MAQDGLFEREKPLGNPTCYALGPDLIVLQTTNGSTGQNLDTTVYRKLPRRFQVSALRRSPNVYAGQSFTVAVAIENSIAWCGCRFLSIFWARRTANH